MDHILKYYYQTKTSTNPHGIIPFLPQGPVSWWERKEPVKGTPRFTYEGYGVCDDRMIEIINKLWND